MAEPSPEQRVAKLFDLIASEYDTTGVPFFQPIADGLLASLALHPGEDLLDVGCGRGAVLLPAAEAVAPGRAVGIDISPVMVDLAGTAAEERGLANAEVRQGSAMSPDVSPSSFDVIASSLVLFFLPDASAALRSWLPILRPSGRVGVTTFGQADAAWQHVDAVLAPYLPQMDARSSGAIGPFASDEGMEQLLRDAGYADVRTVSQLLDVHFADPDTWYRFSMTLGQRAAWLAMPDDVRAEARRETTRRLQELAAPDGSITLRQVVRHSLGTRPTG